MGHYIPKLQYKNYLQNGTTTMGSNILTGMSPTTNFEVGMFVRGTGIPAGALVASKTNNTVTFTGTPATASATVPVSFGVEIIFSYPPIEPKGETIDPKETVSTSLSGINQTIVNHLEALRTPTFSFLSETIKLQLDLFARTWYCLGRTFRYFDDRDSASYIEFESKDLKYAPTKIVPKGINTYVWKVPMSFRRLL